MPGSPLTHALSRTGRTSVGFVTAPMPASRSLAETIEAAVAGTRMASLSAGVQRLMTAYRSGEPPQASVMATAADAAAYAAYRMPATAAACAAALRQMVLSVHDWRPRTLLDFGAGTGGATWAACAALPSLESVTLLEQSAEAVRLGRAIFARSGAQPLVSSTWQHWRLTARGADAGSGSGDSLPAADLATAAYLLGELTGGLREALVSLIMQAAPAVLLVEPGTPAGHRRVLAARDQLLASGYRIAAPCPHELRCPLDAEGEWCHFAARLPRSAVHRQAKAAELAYEDEKFSYVAAVRPPATPRPPAGRVVRRPQQRKGLVLLEECAADGASRRVLVSKSKGESYRKARKTGWGDRWGC